TPRLNIRANTNPAKVGSVIFTLNGPQNQTTWESVGPYSLFGDNTGNYNPWTPVPGSYTLKATPYSGANGTGTAGITLSIAFTVTTNAGGRAQASSQELTEYATGWRFYPNPSSNMVRIEFEAGHTLPLTVDIVDLMGRSVLHIDKRNLEAVDVNVQDILPGLYFITVQSRTGTVSRKLLKQ
ncbi:MAG TPA: T9SS type A sorting domain-containing protein, partial [Fibrella sp.]